MFVRDWMTSPAIVIPPQVPVGDALDFMNAQKIRRFPVVEDGELVGIVTKSDLIAASGALRGSGRIVGDVMASDPVTAAPGDTIENAAHLMLMGKISGLPVVDEGRLVGIITESDVFRAFCDVMGIAERGTRVVLSVPEEEELLDGIARKVHGLTIRSLITHHNPAQGRWEVTLRLCGRATARKVAH